ncbi:hypothetical protein [Nonomuraea sp. 160415]|uniref:hypothetical protein n=1 Tax=Nonomuraea basaltis TaxID=2495887 RepID=UPI00110C5985|nr:hypothetical protein EJK15_13465 [Nonomuraea basaltis]
MGGAVVAEQHLPPRDPGVPPQAGRARREIPVEEQVYGDGRLDHVAPGPVQRGDAGGQLADTSGIGHPQPVRLICRGSNGGEVARGPGDLDGREEQAGSEIGGLAGDGPGRFGQELVSGGGTAALVGQARPEFGHLRRGDRFGDQGGGVVGEGRRPLLLARVGGRASGVDEAASALARVGTELGGALVGGGDGGMATAAPCAFGGAFELSRHLLVRSCARRGQMPGPPVPVQHLGEGPVHGQASADRCAPKTPARATTWPFSGPSWHRSPRSKATTNAVKS